MVKKNLIMQAVLKRVSNNYAVMKKRGLKKNERQNEARKVKISNITVKKSDYLSKCCV